ncbi:MAG TPA: MATE family efflux transporter [Bacteroidales bacterium]|nr:MATE family efflux transporter [Bacteroidales bacterium]
MKDLSYGNEGKLILRFAVPMLLGNIFQQMYNVVDSVVVGRFIGKGALAAVGTSFPIIFMLISFIIGITMGFTIVVSQYFGARDMTKVARTINTLYVFLFFASLIVTIAGILLSKPIFRLIRLPEDIIPDAVLFLNIYFAGLVFLFGFNGTSAILRGLGDSKTPLYFLIGSVLLNIILDIVFVVGFHWGVAGVALGTVISQSLAFFSQILYLNKYHKVVRFHWRDLTFDGEVFKKAIRIGLPTGFQQTFVALGGIALYGIVNKFGVDANAAYSTAGRVDTFALMPAMSFSIALSTFVGQNLGANKPERVKAGFRATLIMTTLISLGISCIAVFLGKYIMMLFTVDPAVVEIGRNYLRIVGAFYLVFSAMFVTGSIMRGAGDTLIPMFITLIALWVIRIPSAVALSGSRWLGINGIWWSIPIGWCFGVTLSYLYYRTGRWKTKAIIKYDSSGSRVE